MKLFEYQGKQLFEKYGIAVPKGKIFERKNENSDMNFPVVMKAQVPVGGRGKAGGIQSADNEKEAKEKLVSILSMTIGGYHVDKVLVEEKISVEKELYLSIVLDRSYRMPLLMASRDGGMDIESVPDNRIIKEWINPLIGIKSF